MPRRPGGIRRRARRLRGAGARAMRSLPGRQPRSGGHRRDRHHGLLRQRGRGGRAGPASTSQRSRSSSSPAWSPPTDAGDRPLPRQPARPGLGVRAVQLAGRRVHERMEPRVGAIGHSHVALCFFTATGTEAATARPAPGGTERDISDGRVAAQSRRRGPAARRRPPGGLAPARHRKPGPPRGGVWSIRSTRRPGRSRRPGCRPSWPSGSTRPVSGRATAATGAGARGARRGLRRRRGGRADPGAASRVELQHQLDRLGAAMRRTAASSGCRQADVASRTSFSRPSTPFPRTWTRGRADALQRSFDHLFELRATRECEDADQTETETTPTETETVPTETETTPTETTPTDAPRPPPPTTVADRRPQPPPDHARATAPAAAAPGAPGGRRMTVPGRGGRPLPHRAPARRGRHVHRLPGHRHRARAAVAVKLLAEHLADDEAFVARFRREALAAARLQHPNVVQVFDSGAGPREPAALHRHGVRGRARRAPTCCASTRSWTWTRPWRSCATPATGSTTRTAPGVVHRDVKPGNLLIAEEMHTTKIADFGIAKAAELTRITQVGSVLGTAAYLSPEQAHGEEAGPGVGHLLARGVRLPVPHRAAAARVHVAHRAGAQAAAGPGHADHRAAAGGAARAGRGRAAVPRARGRGRATPRRSSSRRRSRRGCAASPPR